MLKVYSNHENPFDKELLLIQYAINLLSFSAGLVNF